jgi:hypothetical protein
LERVLAQTASVAPMDTVVGLMSTTQLVAALGDPRDCLRQRRLPQGARRQSDGAQQRSGLRIPEDPKRGPGVNVFAVERLFNRTGSAA